MIFTCPKCKRKLNINSSGGAVCPSGHSYDRSREGYYNLLLSGGGKVHGDNREMVLARRAFLSAGHYLPLATSLARIVAERVSAGGVVLDCGCGEGYYTEKIAGSLGGASLCAFDISKDAVKYASRRGINCEFAVASAYRMPLADGSVDMIYNVFSPLAKDECRRVLKSGGYFLMAIPAEYHLYSLKAKIYDTPYKNTVEDKKIDGFSLVGEEELAYNVRLSGGDEVKNLFMMTPYAYRTSKEGRERVLSLDSLETEISFLLLLYQKL